MIRTTLLVAVLLLAISTSSARPSNDAMNCQVANASKIDCGHSGTTQQQCLASGCCWVPEGHNSAIPWCYHPAQAPIAPVPIPSGPPFNTSEVNTMMGFFLANIDIQGKGGVVASPDNNTPGGSYYYHWMRDGALTMRALMILTDFTTYEPKMKDYTQWVLRKQVLNDPNGIDVREEPKFILPDGGPYTGGWCRPQNDGPALRAATLTDFANNLMAEGSSASQAYVKQYLWTGTSSYNGGAIKYDLDFVLTSYQSSTCDLWEEVHSEDFFWNRFNQRRALLIGAALATKMGDSSSAARYTSAAKDIEGNLNDHWNGQFVFESVNRQKDGAVIVAFNDGYTGDLFPPTGPKVAGTISTLTTLFNTMFAINRQDTQNGIPGVMYGRYEGDHYAGGNPWVLTSGALAQVFYRGASQAFEEQVIPKEKDMAVWRDVLGLDSEATIDSHLEFASLLANQGDAVLYRIRYHVEKYGFHLPEQLDRNTGVPTSATDLTWSYATVLKAMHARTTYLDAVKTYFSALAQQ